MQTAASRWIGSVGATGAELYERNLVPLLFRPFADDLVDAAQLHPGEDVLDVGCGTGIVARLAAGAIGNSGRVVGADVNPDFLEIARTVSDGLAIDWVQADVQDLAVFPDRSFDVALGQQVLQFVPDRFQAVKEIHRVLAPGGRALASVWTLKDAPGYTAIADAVELHIGPGPANGIRTMPFAFQDARTRLPLLLETAGFEKVRLGRHEKILSCSSTEDFVLRIIDTPPIAPAIAAGGPEARGKIVDDVAPSLSRYTLPDGTLSLPMATFVVEGRSPRT